MRIPIRSESRSHRLRRLAAPSLLLTSVVALTLIGTVSPAAASTPRTIVSLGFDDGFANAYTTAAPILASHGMQGTYFIISLNVGTPGYMTWSQIAALAGAGNEIAGHTFTHPDLATLTPTQVRQEVCSNRSDLLSRGFSATDFAYPFGTLGTINAQDEQIVRECGYNSARTSLWYGAGCGSPCTESIPPRDPYWTTVIGWGEQGVAALEQQVTAAEAAGGWAQIVFHGVCDPLNPTCDTTHGTTDPTTLSTFLDWLKLQVANGSVAVRTVQQVIGGPVQPLVQPPVLSGAPPSATNATSASIAFTGESNATFSCSVDSGNPAACTSPVVLSSLANGPHKLAVTQTDTAGDVSTAAIASWTVHGPVAAPVLSGGPPVLTNLPSASIAFTGVTGATFACSVDGGPYAPCVSPAALSGLSDGSHSLGVRQTDPWGDTSPTATATWTVDTTAAPPVLSGVPAAETKATAVSIGFTGESGATFGCSLDGGPPAPCTSPDVLSGLADGAHTLAVTQTDPAGNTSAAATASWTVDTTAAPAVLSGVPAAETNATAASIAFTGESGATFACSLDGGSYAPCASPDVLSGLADGLHTLAVKQTDPAGNTSAAAAASWTVDTMAAPPVLSGVPAATTNARAASIGFTGESGATFACSVDGGSYAPCASPAVLSGLADGPHTLAVKQTDPAGNTSAAATVSWTVVAATAAGGAPSVTLPTVITAPGAPSSTTTVTSTSGQSPTNPPPTGTVTTRLGRRGTVVAVITCSAAAAGACQGLVTIHSTSRASSTARHGTHPPTVLGRAAYTVRPGTTLRVTIVLSAAGRRLLTRQRTLTVQVVISARDGRVLRRRTVILHARTS